MCTVRLQLKIPTCRPRDFILGQLIRCLFHCWPDLAAMARYQNSVSLKCEGVQYFLLAKEVTSNIPHNEIQRKLGLVNIFDNNSHIDFSSTKLLVCIRWFIYYWWVWYNGGSQFYCYKLCEYQYLSLLLSCVFIRLSWWKTSSNGPNWADFLSKSVVDDLRPYSHNKYSQYL